MKLYEFIFLIFGIISLIDYVRYSLFRYKNQAILSITGEPDYIVKKRFIEVILIIITAGIFVHKIIF